MKYATFKTASLVLCELFFIDKSGLASEANIKETMEGYHHKAPLLQMLDFVKVFNNQVNIEEKIEELMQSLMKKNVEIKKKLANYYKYKSSVKKDTDSQKTREDKIKKYNDLIKIFYKNEIGLNKKDELQIKDEIDAIYLLLDIRFFCLYGNNDRLQEIFSHWLPIEIIVQDFNEALKTWQYENKNQSENFLDFLKKESGSEKQASSINDLTGQIKKYLNSKGYPSGYGTKNSIISLLEDFCAKNSNSCTEYNFITKWKNLLDKQIRGKIIYAITSLSHEILEKKNKTSVQQEKYNKVNKILNNFMKKMEEDRFYEDNNILYYIKEYLYELYSEEAFFKTIDLDPVLVFFEKIKDILPQFIKEKLIKNGDMKTWFKEGGIIEDLEKIVLEVSSYNIKEIRRELIENIKSIKLLKTYKEQLLNKWQGNLDKNVEANLGEPFQHIFQVLSLHIQPVESSKYYLPFLENGFQLVRAIVNGTYANSMAAEKNVNALMIASDIVRAKIKRRTELNLPQSKDDVLHIAQEILEDDTGEKIKHKFSDQNQISIDELVQQYMRELGLSTEFNKRFLTKEQMLKFIDDLHQKYFQTKNISKFQYEKANSELAAILSVYKIGIRTPSFNGAPSFRYNIVVYLNPEIKTKKRHVGYTTFVDGFCQNMMYDLSIFDPLEMELGYRTFKISTKSLPHLNLFSGTSNLLGHDYTHHQESAYVISSNLNVKLRGLCSKRQSSNENQSQTLVNENKILTNGIFFLYHEVPSNIVSLKLIEGSKNENDIETTHLIKAIQQDGNIKNYVKIIKQKLKKLYTISRKENKYKINWRDHEKFLIGINDKKGVPFYVPENMYKKDFKYQVERAIKVLKDFEIFVKNQKEHPDSLNKDLNNIIKKLQGYSNNEVILNDLSLEFLKKSYIKSFMKKHMTTLASNPRLGSLWNIPVAFNNSIEKSVVDAKNIFEHLNKVSFSYTNDDQITTDIKKAMEIFSEKDEYEIKKQLVTEIGKNSEEGIIELFLKNKISTFQDIYSKYQNVSSEKILNERILSLYKEKKSPSEIAEIFSRFLDYFMEIAGIQEEPSNSNK